MIDYCANGTALLLWSEIVENEPNAAPPRVRCLYDDIDIEFREKVALTDEVVGLTEAYLSAGVVGQNWYEDCAHVALSTIARADAIVSWNFKHLVRLDRIKAFNAVSLSEGYGMIPILSPKEVKLDEEG